jgi:lambda repressor-like predicted transcriptional regulator
VDSENPINSSHSNIPTREEVWAGITPEPIRKAVIGRQGKFAEEASAIRWTTAKDCHSSLCARVSALDDEPTVLDRFYQRYVQELGVSVRKTFWHLLGSALGHDDELGRIPAPWAREPVEWAKLQTQMLIYDEVPSVRLWLQVACDGFDEALLRSSLKAGCIQGPAKQKDMINELQEYLEEQFPTKKTSAWRARIFLSMVPLGSLPYDLKTAWQYENDSHTRQIISDKRDDLNVALRLELKLAADDAHELRAKASLNVDTCNEQVPAMVPISTEAPHNKRESFVRPLLKKKGWSTADWAIQSGVDFHTADNFLKGTTASYESTRKKLAASLGVNVEDLPS